MSKQFYVYTHARPCTNDVHGIFYVGKGNDKRAYRFYKNERNLYHRRITEKYGAENIIIRILPCKDEDHAFRLEAQIISSLLRMGVKLANMSMGGEGASGTVRTVETRKKISIAKLGYAHTEKTKLKISESLKGKRLGIPRTQETRLKISAKNLGNKNCLGRRMSNENKEKLRMVWTGKKHTEATKIKISINRTGKGVGKVCSKDTKEKISKANKGKICSVETRKKISRTKIEKALAEKFKNQLSLSWDE